MRARAKVLVMIGMQLQLHSSRKSVREKDATMREMRSTYFFIAAGLQYAAVCDKSARSPLLAATEAAGAVSEGTSTQRSRSLEVLLSLVELEPNVTTRQSGLDEMVDMSRPMYHAYPYTLIQITPTRAQTHIRVHVLMCPQLHVHQLTRALSLPAAHECTNHSGFAPLE